MSALIAQYSDLVAATLSKQEHLYAVFLCVKAAFVAADFIGCRTDISWTSEQTRQAGQMCMCSTMALMPTWHDGRSKCIAMHLGTH